MKQLYTLFFTIFFFGLVLKASCYAEGTILIITNLSAKVSLDGTDIGNAEANKPFKINATPGEHYVQVQATINGKTLDKGEIITVEEGKQKVIKLQLDNINAVSNELNSLIHVAELNFTITGALAVGTWINNNPGQNYPYPNFFFAFEKGDEITLDFSMTNKNGTNAIAIATYPAGVVKYTNKAFSELKGMKIKVEERSIYSFSFATNHTFDRNCILKISRKPSSQETANFNTNVSKQKVYKPITVVDPQTLYVNSGSNATWKGGKSRILVPVTVPKNTVEWFYRFSASRNPQDIENVQKNFKLASELTKLALNLSGAGLVAGKAAGIAIDQLSTPPGSDYCDVFLLDYNNIGYFEAKQDESWKYFLQGSRKNIKSGNVRIEGFNDAQYYLGIKNPDSYNGVIVSLEVIALTVSEEYVMEQK